VSSSGAPRKIVGIKSTKICVRDNETMKITNANGGKNGEMTTEIESRKNATRFIWIPGMRPVIVPINIPSINAIINSSSIIYL
jgi:hypothetical protein